jgi:hypothetical protein
MRRAWHASHRGSARAVASAGASASMIAVSTSVVPKLVQYLQDLVSFAQLRSAGVVRHAVAYNGHAASKPGQ